MRLGLVLTALALVSAAPTPAQTVGASFGMGRSDYREFASPRVVGLSVTLPIWSGLRARADARRYSGAELWERSICEGMIYPGDDCRMDVFEGDFATTVLGWGIEVAGELMTNTTVGVAVENTRVRMSGIWTGRESGRTSGEAPRGTDRGWAWMVHVARTFRERLMVRLEGRSDVHDLSLCVLDAYSGFCDIEQLHALELGLHYRW